MRELVTSVSDRRALVLGRVGHEMLEEGASHDQGNGRYNPNDDQYLTFPNDFVRNSWLKVPCSLANVTVDMPTRRKAIY